MDIIYQILSVVGVAGLVGVGIWVGIIQTKVTSTENTTGSVREEHDTFRTKISNHDEMLASVRADHDLLIRLDEKVSLILQRMEKQQG
jgi:hypothetical protein